MSDRPRRRPHYRTHDLEGALLCIFLILLIGIASWWLFSHTVLASAKGAQAEPLATTTTQAGGEVGWYVLTDPVTEVQYLVSDGGGITPRLDEYGTPVGVESYY